MAKKSAPIQMMLPTLGGCYHEDETITDAQIDKICNALRAELCRQRGQLKAEDVQRAFEIKKAGADIRIINRVGSFLHLAVQQIAPTIGTAEANRGLTPQQRLDTLGGHQHADEFMTDAQIDKICDGSRAALLRTQPYGGFKAKAVHRAFEESQADINIAIMAVEDLKVAIYQAAITIVHTVKKVDRSLTPQQMLDATGRDQYTDERVVVTIPSNGTGVQENVYIEFFKLSLHINDADLAHELKKRGLVPDPYAQAQAIKDDPIFADLHPSSTRWRDDNDNECFIWFSNIRRHVSVRRQYDEKGVSVNQGMGGYWWFVGSRKLSS